MAGLVDRRGFLKGTVGTAGLWVAGSACMPPPTYRPPSNGTPFTLGVLSGLHSATEIVIWTRLDPEAAPAVAALDWEVAADPAFADVVASGRVEVGPDADWTAKALVGGLAPDRSWWYRFRAGSGTQSPTSPVGRARTMPRPGDPTARLRLAYASCQEWSSGWYTAWGAIAREDVDAVVWLGDYIYESYGTPWPTDVRIDPVGTATDLAGYRAKYRLYRSDPLLQAGHAAHPFVPVWDDHEVLNNYTRRTITEVDPARGRDAYRAWFEYMPVWPIDGTRIHRSLRWGDLAELTLLDTRQYRDDQANGSLPVGEESFIGVGEVVREAAEAGRTILGDDQRRWLLDTWDAAQADGVRWKLVGNQVMIAPVRPVDLDTPELRALDPTRPRHDGIYVGMDGWDSYQWERDLLLAHLADHAIGDVSFLTGDVHMFWQSTIRADYDDERSPYVANEFVGGAISSAALQIVGNDDLSRLVEQSATTWSPRFRYCDFRRNGYGLVDADPAGMTVSYRATEVATPGRPVVTSVRFHVAAGGPVPTLEKLHA